MDSGQFETFDLVALAGRKNLQCYRAAVLASAAIPAAFEPVFINNSMYVDGGARKHAFFLEQVAAALPGMSANLFGILHGDLSIPPASKKGTPNNLLGVVSRTASIGSDQLMVDSAYYVNAEALRWHYSPHWTAATGTGCKQREEGAQFSPDFGICLWNAGYAKATRDPNPWKELSDVGLR
jgi:hypothetical protein